MTKIKSLDDLRQKKQQLNKNRDRGEKRPSGNLVQIKVAMATCGIASGAVHYDAHGEIKRKISPLL